MFTSTCPECKTLLNMVSIPEIGQFLICTNCKTKLEVTWQVPVILGYQEKEDKKIKDPDRDDK